MKRRANKSLWLLPRVLGISIAASTIACQGRAPDSLQATVQASELQPSDSAVITLTAPAPTPAAVGYASFKVLGRKSLADLESRLGAERFGAVLKINRVDRSHIRTGDTLVIPETSSDLMTRSPFPLQLEVASTIRKMVLVSRRAQAFGAYESGILVRWGPTSTGKKSTPTPAGLYHTNWKARETRSTVNNSWVLPWCFNLDNFGGVSFHKFDLPGYPASHGCVRLLEEDAKWIYDWADQWRLSKTDRSLLAYGTPVVIFGEYSYGEKPPWKRLAEDPNASCTSVAEIEIILSQHMPVIQARALQRESMIAGLSRPMDSVR